MNKPAKVLTIQHDIKQFSWMQPQTSKNYVVYC